MEIVVDANIILAVILNEPDNVQIIEYTKGVDFVAPDVFLMKLATHFLLHLNGEKLRKMKWCNFFKYSE